MIYEGELIKRLNEENIKAFSVETLIDDEYDILLANKSIEEMIALCKVSGINILFYNYSSPKSSIFSLDEDEILDEIKEYVKYFYEDSTYLYRNKDSNILDAIIKEMIDNELKSRVRQTVNEQKKILNLKGGEPLKLILFILYNGNKVGQLITDSFDDEKPRILNHDEIIDNLKEFLNIKLEEKNSQLQEERKEIFKQKCNEEREKYNRAISEIKIRLKNDSTIKWYTNQKLRHDYAKNLTKEYCEEFGVYITIGAVDAIVEGIYRNIKKA